MSAQGMTLTQKILARAAGLEHVQPGQFVNARIDLALANDITGPLAIQSFRAMGAEQVFDRARVALIPDHFTPAKDIESAEQAKRLREFAAEQQIEHYYEVGRAGIEHVMLPELGLALPGEVIVGADSHTCTYGALGAFASGVGSTDLAAAMATGEIWLKVPETIRLIFHGRATGWVTGKDLILAAIGELGADGALYCALEFCGEAIDALSLDSRLSMANMAIEAGAKNGVFAPDQQVLDYVQSRAKREFEPLYADPDAFYCRTIEFDASKIAPQVAMPSLPANARNAADAGEVVLDQVVIGSCTNGRIEDLRIAAKIIEGRSIAPGLRLIVIPGSPAVLQQALSEGLITIFVQAGAAVGPPTCGPCLGGHMGILAAGERCLATTNRNFVGRMGHPRSEVYLSGPAVAAASALAGHIALPPER
ncbi:MAG: 3-isopropylmalate dehydratase large subunit [Candidatus Alcyoniella australis]|nr:3-isopropylmalate dehydratase large subunit [Candidatus Alcyoniella australis]